MTKLLDTNQAAERLQHIKPRTLEKMRIQGRGPAFIKLGRKVVYAEESLEAYLTEQRRTSTSQ